ncbi:MAG: DUF5106 domain-containing protein [Mucinivorans sp.]
MKRIFLILACLSSLVACGSTSAKSESSNLELDTAAVKLAPIGKVSLPMTITDQKAKAEWLAANYWNLFNFTDTTYISSPELEQAFVDWITIMPYLEKAGQVSVWGSVFNKASASSRAMLDEFMRLAEHYLYDPNSPMRNEVIYVSALEAELGLAALPEIEKIRPGAQLKLAAKNAVGTRASDFSYTAIDGSRGRLSGVKGEFLLLFFNDPNCTNCKDVRGRLTVATRVRELEQAGRLRVLAIYAGEHTDEWQDYASNIPARWLNVQCEVSLKRDERYDLRASPTLYLLDSEKRVLLKDCDVSYLLSYLDSVK